ncbi:MAG: radical SAM protein, partial [Deltaproteobacteria bacterium]
PVGLDEEMVSAMAAAGCIGVEIGSDAGTARMLRRLRKPFGVEAIVKAHELFVRHGILDCHTFVLGAFDETAEEAAETLDFVARLDPAAAIFVVFAEDREAYQIEHARHRASILALLARVAPLHRGWPVPELGIRFAPQLTRYLSRVGARGPAWIHLTRRV